ncbi:Uncharacterised protein [Vibrio cholerae]|nr:Uncharacterised protein [Vibrio cholerae]
MHRKAQIKLTIRIIDPLQSKTRKQCALRLLHFQLRQCLLRAPQNHMQTGVGKQRPRQSQHQQDH